MAVSSCSEVMRLGDRVGGLGAQAVEDEGEAAAPCARRDRAGGLDQAAGAPDDGDQVRRGEVGAQAAAVAGARDDPGDLVGPLCAGGGEPLGVGEPHRERVGEAPVGRLRGAQPGHVPDEALPGVGTGQRLLAEGELGVDQLRDDLVDQRLAGGEVVVERADADPGPAGDLLQRGVQAARGEDLAGGGRQPLAVAPRVAALCSRGPQLLMRRVYLVEGTLKFFCYGERT